MLLSNKTCIDTQNVGEFYCKYACISIAYQALCLRQKIEKYCTTNFEECANLLEF